MDFSSGDFGCPSHSNELDEFYARSEIKLAIVISIQNRISLFLFEDKYQARRVNSRQ